MKRPNHVAKPATPPEPAAPVATPEPAAPTAPEAKLETKAELAPPLTLALVERAPAVDVPLSEIAPERYVTARVKRTDPETVTSYAERMKEGDIFPPVELFRDEAGALWLGDGVHRVQAARENKYTSILAKVSEGGRLAALRHAAGANEAHGLRRTPEDKRQAVLMLLAHPETRDLTSRPLAELARVSHTFVEDVRASTGAGTSAPRQGANGKTYQPKKAVESARLTRNRRLLRPGSVKVRIRKALHVLGVRDRWKGADAQALLAAVTEWVGAKPTGASEPESVDRRPVKSATTEAAQ